MSLSYINMLLLFNCSLILSNTILKWAHLQSNRFLWTSNPNSEDCRQILPFLRSPWIFGLLAILKNTLELEQWTNRNQNSIQWTNRKQRGAQRNSAGISPIINASSPKCYHINPVGNGNVDISSEEHFENWKSQERCRTYLLLELFIFGQLFEFHLVTKSL